jgi:hypothetical protein
VAHTEPGDAHDALQDEQRQLTCDHGITFDAKAARGLPAAEVRRRWPRLDGRCPKGCGYVGIAYVSREHYYCGDW